ncbi:MAG: MFS transporter [Defluviitaleaceae bacterium]|nr:MFS transporter [Defluviitaleaceae bacterium]
MKSNIFLFYIVTAIFWFSLYAYVPYVAPYAEYMEANHRMIGLIAGSYGFTQMIIRFPLGIFSDKIGKRKIFVILGTAFAAAAGFLVFFAPSPLSLLIARALGGVAASAWVAFTILGAGYYPPDNAAKAMGHLSACNSAGRMLALLGGALLAFSVGFELSFLLGGVAGIFGVALSFFVKEKPEESVEKCRELRRVHKKPAASGRFLRTSVCERTIFQHSPGKAESPPLSELLAVAKNRQLLACSVLGILAMFVSFATTFGFVPIAAVALDATPFHIGLLGVVSAGTGILISPFAGTILPKKFGVCATLVIGFLLSAAGSVLIAATGSIAMLFAVQVAGSVGLAILGTLLLGLCIRDISPARRATAMGFFQAVYGIGMFLGPFVAGHISHAFDLNTAFIFTGFVGVAGAICTVIYAKKGCLMY